MNVKIPIFYSAFDTKSCCSISLAGARMYQRKGACPEAVGDLAPEESDAIVKPICVRAFTAIAVSPKNRIPHVVWVTTFRRTWRPWLRDRSEEPRNDREETGLGSCSQGGGRIRPPSLHQRLRALPQPICWCLFMCRTPQTKLSFCCTSTMCLLLAHFAQDYFRPLPFGKGEGWGADWWNGLYGAAQQTRADPELLMLGCDFVIINTESVPRSYDFDRA